MQSSLCLLHVSRSHIPVLRTLFALTALLIAGCSEQPGSEQPGSEQPGSEQPGSVPEPEAQQNAGIWAEFRGPDGMGFAADSKLPEFWSLEKGIRWQTMLPDGIAQPIVSNDRIFVTGARHVEPEVFSRVVLGLEKSSGEILWETEVLAGPREEIHYKFSSLAMASPVTNGEQVFAYFGPSLGALSRDGQLIWHETIDSDYWAQSRYGAASSPVLFDDKILIFRDLENGGEADKEQGLKSWLAAYSQEDGSLVWKTEWSGTCCSYVTPTIAERPDGSRQILITSSPFIKGFDLETGAELWTVDYPSVQVVPSSSISGDLFVASGAVHDRLTAGFRLTGSGADTQIKEEWRIHKAVPEIASPVVHESTLYQVTEAGIATALNIRSGKANKRWRLPQGPYRASMIIGDNKIYAMSARGTVSIWRPRPSLEMIGTFPLPQGTGPYLSMAASDDCLLARARRALYCIEGAESPPVETIATGESSAGKEAS